MLDPEIFDYKRCVSAVLLHLGDAVECASELEQGNFSPPMEETEWLLDLRRRMTSLSPEPQPEEIEAFLERGMPKIREYARKVIADAVERGEMDDEIPACYQARRKGRTLTSMM